MGRGKTKKQIKNLYYIDCFPIASFCIKAIVLLISLARSDLRFFDLGLSAEDLIMYIMKQTIALAE